MTTYPTCSPQVVARSRKDILAARGVKPTLSPNLSVLATVEALGVKRLLFIGVGCQVQVSRPAQRAVSLMSLIFSYLSFAPSQTSTGAPVGPLSLPFTSQALRAVEPYLGLEKLYVLGTNCVVGPAPLLLPLPLQLPSCLPLCIVSCVSMLVPMPLP